MPFSQFEIVLLGAAFLLAVATTWMVRGLASKIGMVARPRTERWHKKPTALLGGVAIFATVLVFVLVSAPHPSKTWFVVGASAFLWLLGLVDDFRQIKPYQKLIGQVLGAALVIYADLSLNWTDFPLVNIALTVLWLVGITNAINLLDNMDGLAAGISTIASIFLAINLLQHDQPADAWILGIFVAALLGFLVYNTHPASIFMGDCGSMFVGFFLASAALLDDHAGRSRSLLPVLAVPALVLVIPIFDVTLVTIVRKLSGRAVSQGGRDHSSHRLVALGLTEMRGVLLLYSLAVVSGIVGLAVRDMQVDLAIAVIAALTLVLALLGTFLAGVKVYDDKEIRAARENSLIGFVVNLSHKRRVFEVLLDLCLIVLAYYTAVAITFGPPSESSGGLESLVQVIPVLLFVKMATFLVMGVYRGLWRYISIDNLVQYAKAAAVASALSMLAVVILFRFEGYSRAVFVLDGFITFFLLAGSRMAFRFFRHMLPMSVTLNGRRVLIYGAGDGGELLLRELRNNRKLGCVPVGFVDDDPFKQGQRLHGLKVHAGQDLGTLCKQQAIDEVMIAIERLSEERVRRLVNDCMAAKVQVRRMRIHMEHLGHPGTHGIIAADNSDSESTPPLGIDRR